MSAACYGTNYRNWERTGRKAGGCLAHCSPASTHHGTHRAAPPGATDGGNEDDAAPPLSGDSVTAEIALPSRNRPPEAMQIPCNPRKEAVQSLAIIERRRCKSLAILERKGGGRAALTVRTADCDRGLRHEGQAQGPRHLSCEEYSFWSHLGSRHAVWPRSCWREFNLVRFLSPHGGGGLN